MRECLITFFREKMERIRSEDPVALLDEISEMSRIFSTEIENAFQMNLDLPSFIVSILSSLEVILGVDRAFVISTEGKERGKIILGWEKGKHVIHRRKGLSFEERAEKLIIEHYGEEAEKFFTETYKNRNPEYSPEKDPTIKKIISGLSFDDEGICVSPVKDEGVDAGIRINFSDGEEWVICLDDTSTARSFSEDQRAVMILMKNLVLWKESMGRGQL